ncbi:MAG: 2-succinyl-5-enolpyruvyl-6-hydroxy-3-cyclohexene-1-carboxylic-acid synthase [bacterium]
MKKLINRNTLWTQVFVNKLTNLGVRYVCISPGSRSTPLVIAFASNKKIKSFVHVDERISGFFALGLAKKTNSPVAIVTTSGTAVAELYPSIIEAYQQRIPLIICTADRPPELFNRGANQTINQSNIYQNHIRKFFEAGMPQIDDIGLSHISMIAADAVQISTVTDRGPVHVNFPFKEPFEQFNFTDEVEENILTRFLKIEHISRSLNSINNFSKKYLFELTKKITSNAKGIIYLGPEFYDANFLKLISRLSDTTKYPVLVDGAGNARFSSELTAKIITNHTAFFRSKKFTQEFDPEIIFHFGSAPTSNITLKIFEVSKAEKILINEYGDWKDPSGTAKKLIKITPFEFCMQIITELDRKKFERHSTFWMRTFQSTECHCEDLKQKIISSAEFPFEGRIAIELIEAMPDSANLMISNSTPIRDVDFFASALGKKLNIFTNRGASGIDGIISTSAGIAAQSKVSTFLIIGDLSFYHDLNGLLTLKKYSIPLKIILINNSGGGIFEFLPVKNEKKHFKKYFKTSQEIPFSKIIKAYGGNYSLATSWTSFRKSIRNSFNNKTFSVIELVTDSKKSLDIRKKYWKKVVEQTNKLSNDNSD